jgi:lambda family phage portal protein
MGNFIDGFLAAVAPKAALRRALARRALDLLEVRAGYDAAGKGRRGMFAKGTHQNAESRRSLVALRNNARELQRNNPYASSALQAVVSGTIGSGIKPVASHPTSKKKKKLADELMAEWSNSLGCDHDGRLNLFGLQALAMQTESLSGEGLLVRRIVDDPTMRIPLKLQLLEGDFLDHTKDGVVSGGSSIIQGIQVRDGMRESYWLFDSHPGESSLNGFQSKPVSADQVAHIYDMIRPGQMRGVPRGVSAFTRLKLLDDYQDARLELQKMASCIAGFIFNEEGNDKQGDILPTRLEPGLLARLNGDERISFNTPPSSSDHASFIVPEQRVIATAWGITYEALTGDYSGVNFASGKMGRIQMFSNVHRWRFNMMIPQFCKTVERWFLEAAKLKGYDLSGVTFDWTPPKKEILDPAAEIPAIIKEIRAGLNSFQGACRERGIDPELLLRQIKEDIDLFDQYGLVLDIDPRRVTSSGQMQSVGDPAAGIDLSTNDQGVPGDEDESEIKKAA